MDSTKPTTHQKAFRLNMDPLSYGTIAEIGAGQEVARWFFLVGGAAGTVAKTLSTYDKTISDAVYGTAKRYVSRERLLTMLDHEYELLVERLSGEGGGRACFAFADTVTARSYFRPDEETHGWMGIRFRLSPSDPPSEILIHLRMHDRENVQQQEALGILGVNLIYAAYFFRNDPPALVRSLLDELGPDRLEVNLIRFSGPSFQDVDTRLMALELIKDKLTPSARFTASGEVVDAGELLYRKPFLIERGSFRPVTKTTLDMLHRAQERFCRDPEVLGDEPLILAEMSLRSLNLDEMGHGDYLDRIDTLSALGKNVLVSNSYRDFRLVSYLSLHSRKKIGAVVGLPAFTNLFREEFYSDLEGGILEAFGRLFKNRLRLYVYPARGTREGKIVTLDEFQPSPHLRPLYEYLRQNGFVEGIEPSDAALLDIYPKDVLAKIRSADSSWEAMVPPEVASLIKERGLFDYRPA